MLTLLPPREAPVLPGFVTHKPRAPGAPGAIGVVGIGNSGRALGAWFASQGQQVHLLTRNAQRLSHLGASLRLESSGRLQGRFELASVTDDPARFVLDSPVIFVTTVATVYREVAERLAPHLRPSQRIILFSSKLGGSLEFHRALVRRGVQGVEVGETDALFACRTQAEDSVWVRGIKAWNLFSAPTRSMSRNLLPLLNTWFPQVREATNLVERGLSDFGALAHPVIMVANANRVDRCEPFLFYVEGLTDRTVRLLESMAREFRAVGEAYDAMVPGIPELLRRYYGGSGDTPLEAMLGVPNYRTSAAPAELDHRYLWEDVACTLVPAQALGRKASIPTPMMDSIVTQASILLDRNLQQEGRTLERLGWADFSYSDIRRALRQ